MASDALKRLRATNTDQLLPRDFRALLDIAEAAHRLWALLEHGDVSRTIAFGQLRKALSKLGGNNA